MAICGLSKSRNLLARKRLQQRNAARRVLLESLEARQLLTVGPQLLGVQPSSGDLLENGEVLNVSPRELVFRFDDTAGIDPTTLDGIRVVRSGEDGVFERASAATDFGTGGQTLVEFFAREPGESGNGIQIEFTSRSHNQGRAPIIAVEGRTIRVELNSNPLQETRVEEILQAFAPGNLTPATELAYALRLRGSQVIGIGSSGARTLVLTGANAAKASTNFNINNSLEVRFIARDSGNDGIGIQINVTARDRGGAGNPIVSVVGKTINVEINSNTRFPTTVKEFVDALNASDSLSSALIDTQLVSGVGATRLGSFPITYSPIKLSGVLDVEVVPAYVGLGDTDREVIMRFAEALPDDQYRIEILGQGSRTLRNVNGEAFNSGESQAIAFELDLGAQIESVIPQPVSRGADGKLVQERNKIDIYFNDDDLIDVSRIVSVNGIAIEDFRNLRTPLFFDTSDVIVFASGAGQRSVLNPSYYQLFYTADTLTNTDDVRVLPSSVRYYPSTNRAILSFSRNLDQLTDPNSGAVLPPAGLRLRVGSNEETALPPITVDGLSVDPESTFSGAMDLNGVWTPGAGGSQSVIIDSEIVNTSPLLLDFPGGSDEPGNRHNRYQDNLRLSADSVDGTSVLYYNFQSNLGVYSNSNLLNAITEQQKQRVREIFSIYEDYLGIRFVETRSLGMTVAVGDMRAIVPFEDVVGSGVPGVVEFNGPGGTYYEAGTLIGNGQLGTVLDIQDFSSSLQSAFGGPFQRAAMQAIGRLLGLGLADEAASLTIQAFNAAFAPGVGTEIILPGDADIVHGQYLYRPDSKDIDLYQFSIPVDGRITIEAFAERMSSASLLDSQIRLYQQNTAGEWDEIASNDDYFSSDSFLELDLAQGNYILGVSASGNATYDPTIDDTGIGGRSQGEYQLRIDFRPPAEGLLRDATGTAFDGDGDGSPEGVFNFWFRPAGPSNTKFVDKSASAGGNGSLAAPYNKIATALAVAQPGDVVRIVGNGGTDGKLSTASDNLAYEIGYDILGRPLADGATMDVPKDVSVMIDAGAILKMRRSRVGVGSTSVSVDRSAGSLLILGTPTLLDSLGNAIMDSTGNPVAGSVVITSLNDSTVGRSTSSTVVGSAPKAGDWGGIDFRNKTDQSFANRENLEKLGQFMNWVSHVDIRYGGGQVVVDGVEQSISAVNMVDARPTVTYSQVSTSSGAAMSATPNSFLESNFHSPAEQGSSSFTVDYDRVGPDLNMNRMQNNAINGLQVRVRSASDSQVTMTVPGRFDDADIVHYIPENLVIQGTPGGAVLANEGPSSTSVQLSEQVGGSLPPGVYNYRFTSVDGNGVESSASEPTSSIFTFGAGSVVLSNLPLTINRIYRSTAIGDGPYELIAEFQSNSTVFVDAGGGQGTFLADDLEKLASRLDARLAIDPGVVVKLNGSRIDVDFGAQLIAEGQDGIPVIFTSLSDTRYGAGGTFQTANTVGQDAREGDWGGIYIGHTSSASLDHAVIAYGGGTTRIEGGFADFNAVEVHQGRLRLANSRLELNHVGSQSATSADRGGRGTNDVGTVFVRGSQPVLVDNIIQHNLGPAISINVSALNSTHLDDYGRATGRSDAVESIVGNQGPLIAGNQLDNNDINGLVVRGGNLTTEGVWDDTDIVHVVFDEIVISDHQHYSGLRLMSAEDASLVVKLSGADAGFTATGVPLDNADRIGGSVQLMGNAEHPVILTSLEDCSVGAGFTVNGAHQVDTNNTGFCTTVDAVDYVDVLVIMDESASMAFAQQFAVGFIADLDADLRQAGIGNSSAGTNLFGLVGYGNVNQDPRAIPVGTGGELWGTSIEYATASTNLVDNGAIEDGYQAIHFALDTYEFREDAEKFIILVTNEDRDIRDASLTYQNTLARLLARDITLEGIVSAVFLDGQGFQSLALDAESNAYSADGNGGFNVSPNGSVLFGSGSTITDYVDMIFETDGVSGDINQIQAGGFTAQSFGNALISSIVVQAGGNPAAAGDWRSVLIDTYSNDRNVAITSELESPLSDSPSTNELPSNAQFLGEIAPNEKAGDENRRLGIQLEGQLSRAGDVDVYSFRAAAGSEVWLDIDRTDNALDTVVELVDANGRTLALSDDSFAEEADPSRLYSASDMPPQSVNPLRKSAPEFYYQSAQGDPKDLFSTNPRDAGMRVILPGEVGSTNLYHIRVRSSSLLPGDPASQLLDPARVSDGLTKGSYVLQIRINEDDEVPGSAITYADIRFATNGVELVGVPGNSPLTGENGELEGSGGQRNDAIANAQALGNLLATNRQAISVAGNLDNVTDVDWYSFDIQYERITPTALREYFSTIIDMDYADGIGRPDTSLYVFDSNNNLILAGLNSSIVDDQANPVSGADNSDLSRGSAGTLDPYIGAYELPAGRYFLAITNSNLVPEVLATYTDPNSAAPEMRLQPIEVLELVAEDHIELQGGSTAVGPRTPILFPQVGDFDGNTFYDNSNDSIVDFTLSDITLYVSRDVGNEQTNIYIVNPFTGETRSQVGRGAFDVQDIDFRPNGQLRAFDRTIESTAGGNVDLDTLSDYIDITPGDGQFTDVGDLGLQTTYLNVTANPPAPADANDGFNVEAITFAVLGGQERGFVVGNRPTPFGEVPAYYTSTGFIDSNNPAGFPGFSRPGISNFTNVIYEFDETSGTATSAPAADKQNAPIASGAGTAVRERGRIETFTLDALGNIVTESPRLLAREVTSASTGGANFVIRDGDRFTVRDGGGFLTTFEFNLGPQVLVDYNPAQGRSVTDGMQFSLDGNVYEFDTGSVIVVNANSGAQLSDGSTVTVVNAAGVGVKFEFDNNGQLNGAGNVAVKFTPSSTQSNLVQSLADAINNQPGFGVKAQFTANINRISLVNASTTVPVQVTGTGLSVSGMLGVTPGATRIPISEAASLNEFLLAISTHVASTVTVGYEAGRLNFSGATSGSFTDLTSAGIFTDLFTSGNVSPGSIAVNVLASDTAEAVAIRITQAINNAGIPGLSATALGSEVQLVGVVVSNAGPLAQLGIAPGGLVTGIAVIGNTMYAVSDAGGLYRVANPTQITQGNVGTYVTTAYDLVGIQFSGLVEGPVHLQNGQLSQVLFGIDTNGVIHAFDTQGRLQPIFANGATSVATGLTGANGLTMSSLDFNLWHVTGQRNGDAGHGLPDTPNDSRVNFSGGQSLYFGFQSPGANGVADLSGANSTGLTNSYNFPGGAAGAVESAPFSLTGVSADDLPTLYFSYFFETEQAASDLPLGSTATDYMRDSLRVYASGEDGQWILLATNNDPPHTGSNSGSFDDEFDGFLTGNFDVQPLFDNNASWRQARVPLDLFAGQANVKLRIEFSSNGGFGYGLQGGRGPEIRTISGDRLVDGQTLTVNGQAFEIELGPTLTLPGGPSISNGESVTIDGIRYVFTDGSLVIASPDVAVPYSSTMSAEQVALALQSAIQNATITSPTVSGLTYTHESNDTISRAELTGINGDSVTVIGSGDIGDNPTLADVAEDVDLVRVDLSRGAVVTVSVNAATIGSSLDSYLRVFDAFGQPLLDAAGQPIVNNDRFGSTDSRLTFTAPEDGIYYIGVSGAGNQDYNPAVANTGTAGSTGEYDLVISVQRRLVPSVAQNRLQLDGAQRVSLGAGSRISLQGGMGATGVPVYVSLDMTAGEVAAALQQSLAGFFAGGTATAYPTKGNVVDLTGLVNYSSFDFFTGLPTPSLTDLDPGPFGATTNFVGDAFGAFNTGTNFDGSTNNARPGALGAQANDFEGVYLDDFIIGVAGRGEMVLRSSGGNTNFIQDPQQDLSNPRQPNLEIQVGPYQFEIRGGDEYGIPTLAGFPDTFDVTESVAFDDRTVPGISIRFNPAVSMVAGQTFEVGDGSRVLIFEMDDVNDGQSVQPGHVALPFSTAVFDPISGARLAESAEVIAARFRDIINSSTIQAQLNIAANLLNNDSLGATSTTVVLIGPGTAQVPASVGNVIVTQVNGGGANRERPQGQVVVSSSKFSNSLGFGVTIASSAPDPVTGAVIPGAPRNTVTINSDRLAPGAVVMNSEFLFNDAGGIHVTGAQTSTNSAAAVPFVRLVNNTIVGGTISAVTALRPTVEGGQIFNTGNLAFADAVVSYNNLAGGGPAPIAGLDDPTQALGPPNFSGSGEPLPNENVVSLGRGGQIVLEFNNNFLTGSGDANPDLMIFEVGDSEEVLVEVSVDNIRYIPVGRASAASPKIDIDAFGFNPNSRIAFVRLTDVANQGATTGDSVGADIDAVGAISSVPAENAVSGGRGIVIEDNISATVLNNAVINSTVGIEVDASSATTVIGGTLYQLNDSNVAGSATIGQFATVLQPNIPVFVSAGTGNLYPAPGSPIIDSSIDSLADRPSLTAVKRPLGIADSPILAPEYDINGQLRINDPNVDAPSGLGENVFKDRGAQDRADFAGPSVLLQYPVDNDNKGLDSNPTESIVELTNINLSYFDIRIADGIPPSDPNSGTGVNHSTVRSSSVLVYRNDTPLVEGIDYRFGYDSTNGVIRLQPLAGLWQTESVYTIRFVNSSESSVVAKPASTYTDGDQFTILDNTGSQTIFEIDLGYLVSIPSSDGVTADLTDGTNFIMDDGIRRYTFEFDGDGSTTPDTIPVNIGTNPTVEAAAMAIQSAIAGTPLHAQAVLAGNGLQILGNNSLQFDVGNSGLTATGRSGAQTVFGIQIPLEQGVPVGLTDGQVFTIDRSGAPVTFEIDTNGTVLDGNVPVQFADNASAAQVGAALVTAIDGAGLGLSPSYDGNGLVRLGGDANTRLDMTNTVLTQTGVAGEPAAVQVVLLYGAPASEVATLLKAAIESQNLPDLVVTQFGTRLLLSGIQGVSGTGANLLGAIRDLAGNPLKPNQNDGSTTLTVFMGEGFDYGDAGPPYMSTAAEGGPRHTVQSGLSLGPTVTVDADAKLVNADLDDGVVFSNVFAAFQTNVQINVVNTTGSDAYVSLWMDFNGDGFFASSERMIASQVINQPTTVSFLVPASAIAGQTYSRIRLSTDPNAVSSPVGNAPDGEVEDFLIKLQGNPFTNGSNNLDVNSDGYVSPIDALQVRNYLNDPTKPTELSLPAANVPPYIDVNGDGFVSAIDALLVINFLNNLAGGGEGELAGIDRALLSSSSEETVLASDWAVGLENQGPAYRVRSAEQENRFITESIHDFALLDTEQNDDSTLALSLDERGTSQLNATDLAWADLSDSDDAGEDLFSNPEELFS